MDNGNFDLLSIISGCFIDTSQPIKYQNTCVIFFKRFGGIFKHLDLLLEQVFFNVKIFIEDRGFVTYVTKLCKKKKNIHKKSYDD